MDAARLQDMPLFAGLSRRERKTLAALVDEVEVPEGRELAQEGTLAYELFVIEEGTAEVIHDGARIRELGPGDFFGEIALLDEERRRTSTVVATSPMKLAVLQGHDLRRIDAEMPSIARQIHAAIEERRAADASR